MSEKVNMYQNFFHFLLVKQPNSSAKIGHKLCMSMVKFRRSQYVQLLQSQTVLPFIWANYQNNPIHIPLRPTRRWTDAHFCRFLTVLDYSPIGEKFPPTIAPRTLYTVQKKKLENFKNFFCFESFNAPK